MRARTSNLVKNNRTLPRGVQEVKTGIYEEGRREPETFEEREGKKWREKERTLVERERNLLTLRKIWVDRGCSRKRTLLQRLGGKENLGKKKRKALNDSEKKRGGHHRPAVLGRNWRPTKEREIIFKSANH